MSSKCQFLRQSATDLFLVPVGLAPIAALWVGLRALQGWGPHDWPDAISSWMTFWFWVSAATVFAARVGSRQGAPRELGVCDDQLVVGRPPFKVTPVRIASLGEVAAVVVRPNSWEYRGLLKVISSSGEVIGEFGACGHRRRRWIAFLSDHGMPVIVEPKGRPLLLRPRDLHRSIRGHARD